MFETDPNKFCPRLLDYVIIVGAQYPNSDQVAQSPELLRIYPTENHSDFVLPPDVVYFCQPEGCITTGQKRVPIRDKSSFVFAMTDKESGLVRYGTCVNFFRSFSRTLVEESKNRKNCPFSKSDHGGLSRGVKSDTDPVLTQDDKNFPPKFRHHKETTLTSLCIISHHPFFSLFRQCLNTLRKLIDSCENRCRHRKSGKSIALGDTIWSVLTGCVLSEELLPATLRDVRELEIWILKLLSAPVPVPGKTRIEIEVLPLSLQSPITFALPENTRFTLCDFPLHLPLELLGVETCMKVLAMILAEHKVVLQSQDYNALSMSIMSFVSMIYPLQYMFPIIPLLPTCMNNAEQLLLAPTPFIIGVPATFFLYKKSFRIPDDVWIIDLDTNRIIVPSLAEDVSQFPEPEVTILKKDLKQIMDSMSSNCPISDLSTVSPLKLAELQQQMHISNGTNTFLYGNDVDSVDVAVRVAMVRFFNSPNMLSNHTEHTRVMRLHPRPVVAFRLNSFMKSRPKPSLFLSRFARTTGVEYFCEWSLNPDNVAFMRVHTGIVDPLQIGDKQKWFSQNLTAIDVNLHSDSNSLLNAVISCMNDDSDNSYSDLSGNESSEIEDFEDQTTSSYSSLGDFVSDMRMSRIPGEFPDVPAPTQPRSGLDYSSVYDPPNTLQLPCCNVLDPSHGPFTVSSGDEGPDSSDEEDSKIADSDSDKESGDVSIKEFKNPIYNQKSNLPSNMCHMQSDANSNMSVYPLALDKLKSLSACNTPGPASPKGVYAERRLSIDSKIPPKISDIASSESSFSQSSQNYRGDPGKRIKMITSTGFANATPKKLTSRETPNPFPTTRSKTTLDWASVLGNSSRISDKVAPVRQATIDENQSFLREIISGVLNGNSIGYFKLKTVRNLLQNENLRAYTLSSLNHFANKGSSDGDYIDDFEISRPVCKSLVSLIRAMIVGLELSWTENFGMGGLSSVYGLLEIMHTFYYITDPAKEKTQGLNKVEGMIGNATRSLTSLLSDRAVDSKSIDPADVYSRQKSAVNSTTQRQETADFEVITDQEIAKASNSFAFQHGSVQKMSDSCMKKLNSVDSEISEDGTIVSHSSSDTLNSEDIALNPDHSRKKTNLEITKSTLSDSELEIDGTDLITQGSKSLKVKIPKVLQIKSMHTLGYRYRCSKLIPIDKFPSKDEACKRYLFEFLLEGRSSLWENSSFWDDVYLDGIAAEREAVGMDFDTLSKYQNMSPREYKQIGSDEDRLLSSMLYNLCAFMIMMGVNKKEIRKKIRRLLGRCHIGLQCSSIINDILDIIPNVAGNDVDLRPVNSRQMWKHSFVAHSGTNTNGDVVFIEVCDESIVVRNGMGVIRQRLRYEKLINITYCPKTQVLCLWWKKETVTKLSKYCTTKCKSLYYCIKDCMERAALRSDNPSAGPDLGGEFPIQDLKTGEGGLLDVTLEGIGLKFANTKYFISLANIQECHTKKGLFLLREYIPDTKETLVRKYQSSMSNEIWYAVLCVISCVTASAGEDKAFSSYSESTLPNL